jgi:NAD(P)-dependent dehydrogenase (short-subunit alcohol dehydrogenase family)
MNEQKVVVTGGARGIGKAISLKFASEGFEVIVADRDAVAVKELLDNVKYQKGTIRFIETDISDPAQVVSLMRDAAGKSATITVLVNNAGFGIWKSPDMLSVDEWDSVIDTNLRGAFLCSREAAGYMKASGGSIINIASTRALMSEPNSEAYAASKGGLIALTHALSASYAEFRIRVNCISPGWIETGDYSRLKKSDHEQHFSGRVGKPEDIANACWFLWNNDFINGENLIIDGGMTRKMIYAE